VTRTCAAVVTAFNSSRAPIRTNRSVSDNCSPSTWVSHARNLVRGSRVVVVDILHRTPVHPLRQPLGDGNSVACQVSSAHLEVPGAPEIGPPCPPRTRSRRTRDRASLRTQDRVSPGPGQVSRWPPPGPLLPGYRLCRRPPGWVSRDIRDQASRRTWDGVTASMSAVSPAAGLPPHLGRGLPTRRDWVPAPVAPGSGPVREAGGSPVNLAWERGSSHPNIRGAKWTLGTSGGKRAPPQRRAWSKRRDYTHPRNQRVHRSENASRRDTRRRLPHPTSVKLR